MQGLLACTDDLTERAASAPLSKLKPKNDDVSWNSQAAHHKISHEWKELELGFLFALIQELKLYLNEVDHAISKADARRCLPDAHCRELSRFGSRTQKQTTARTQHSLRVDITRMEVEIAAEQQRLDLWDASIAPCSAILCQATEHLSLCGFCLEHFDDDELILRFHHAGQDEIETRVVFSMSHDSLPEVVVDPLYSLMKESPFIECRKGFMNMLIGGNIPLTKEIRELELQDCTLKLSRWLGKLDLVIADLQRIADNGKVRIEYRLPCIAFTTACGTVAHVTLDPCNDFLTSDIDLRRPGSNESERWWEIGTSLFDIVSAIVDLYP